MQPLFELIDRLVISDYLEYVVAGVVVLVWWIVSKTRYTLRQRRGVTEADTPLVDEERPRRRDPQLFIPLSVTMAIITCALAAKWWAVPALAVLGLYQI